MKKIISIMLVILMAVSLVACAQQPAGNNQPATTNPPVAPTTSEAPVTSDAPAEPPAAASEYAKGVNDKYAKAGLARGDMKLTYGSPVLGNDYWDGVKQGVEAAATEFAVDVNIVSPGAQSDLAAYLILIETAIAQRVDGILSGSNNQASAPPVFSQAVEANIPIVSVDNDAPGSGRLYYIGTSNYNAGFGAGQLMVEQVGGAGEVAIVTGSLTGDSALARMDGFEKALEGSGITVVTKEVTEGDAAIAVQKAEAIANAYPDLKGVFGVQVYDGPGAATVNTERNLGWIVIGFDEVPALMKGIEEGFAYCTTVQRTYYMGYMGIKYLIDILEGNAPADEIVDSGVQYVTKDMLATYKEDLRKID